MQAGSQVVETGSQARRNTEQNCRAEHIRVARERGRGRERSRQGDRQAGRQGKRQEIGRASWRERV